MESPVAERTAKCLQRFERLTGSQTGLKTYDRQAEITLTDSYTRFRIWAANLGAFHSLSDKRSADFRLRNSRVVLDNVRYVLDELLETLDDIEEVFNQLSVVVEDQGVEQGPVRRRREAQQLCDSVSDLITSLLKISILVRRGTARDRYAKAAAANYSEFLRSVDIGHVMDKFPKTNSQPWLQERLGNAITRRREYLRYARDHHDRIASLDSTVAQVRELEISAQRPNAKSAIQSSQVAGSSAPTQAVTTASTFQMPSLSQEPSYNLDEEYDDDHTRSFVSSKASDQGSGKLRVVQLEDLQKLGAEFECPYCRGIVRTKKQSSWQKHVFKDLRAYVCTFQNCSVGMFESVHTWFQHELDHHRRQWMCFYCTHEEFKRRKDLKKHIEQRHAHLSITEDSLESALKASSRPMTEIPPSACPLCDEWGEQVRQEAQEQGLGLSMDQVVAVPSRQFQRHLGRHQEQLALFAIPPSADFDDSDEGSQDTTKWSDPPRPDIVEWQNTSDTESDDSVQDEEERVVDENPLEDEDRETQNTVTESSEDGDHNPPHLVHWAQDVFDGQYPSHTYELRYQSMEESLCLGSVDQMSLEHLVRDGFIQALELSFGGDELFVRFYFRPSDSRARILVIKPGSGNVDNAYFCIPMTNLKVTRRGSCLEFSRLRKFPKKFVPWLVLNYYLHERMVLSYGAFVAMKRQDRRGVEHEDLLEENELMNGPNDGEELLFSGIIKEGRIQQALRLWKDRSSGVVRLEAMSRGGPMDNVPLWTAFVTRYAHDPDWAYYEGDSLVSLSALKPPPYVLLAGYQPPKRGFEYLLAFDNRSDARTFVETWTGLCRSAQ